MRYPRVPAGRQHVKRRQPSTRAVIAEAPFCRGCGCAADVETLEEHPTEAATVEPAQPPERKRPANGARTNQANPRSTSPFAVALEGNTAWSVSNNVLNMKVDRISHGGTGTTGSLRL